jgi:hypothetical protein
MWTNWQVEMYGWKETDTLDCDDVRWWGYVKFLIFSILFSIQL